MYPCPLCQNIPENPDAKSVPASAIGSQVIQEPLLPCMIPGLISTPGLFHPVPVSHIFRNILYVLYPK